MLLFLVLNTYTQKFRGRGLRAHGFDTHSRTRQARLHTIHIKTRQQSRATNPLNRTDLRPYTSYIKPDRLGV